MTKPASTTILAAISTLPVILGCALLGATEARADKCSADGLTCPPYVATIDKVGPNVVATGSGEFNFLVCRSRVGANVVATGSGDPFDFLVCSRMPHSKVCRMLRAKLSATSRSQLQEGP